ncbi:SGNH/GDSL hydrolase family protein, partial [Commensalibacter communis]|uniref:hypothetical protein n=1 Tax=Commensalibacter communis TaxID=2972786 RepID=UPI00232E46F8
MDADIPRDFRDIDIAAFNIGSNDGDMSSENFIAAASEMIDDLRTRYPDMILLFTTPFWGTHQSSWLAVSEKYADDAKVIYIETIYP